MKLIINYDLINEITKANTGINFKRAACKTGIYMGVLTSLNLTSFIAGVDVNSMSIVPSIVFPIVLYTGSEFALKDFNKREADARLSKLASSLRNINIYTSPELIKNASLYKTEFKLVHDDGLAVQQNKYIMLTTNGSFNADQVSLLQEHEIGSRDYVLSIGEPKKTYSKFSSKVFAR